MRNCLLSILFIIVAVSSSIATNRYVSKSGNDSNPGTEALPYLTIAKGVSVLVAGDVLTVEDGTYTLTGSEAATITQDGNSGAWITIKSRNKWGAKIVGKQTGTLDYESGFNFNGGNYIKIENFEFSDLSFAGIRLLDGTNSNVEIRNCKIQRIGRYCTDTFYGLCAIVLDRTTNVLVEKCWIENIGRYESGESGCTPSNDYYKNHDHGIYLNGVTTATIKNNVFVGVKRGQAIHVYSGSGYTTTGMNVINNTFYDGNPYSAQSAGHIILWSSLSNSTIANNIFHTQYSYAIQVYQGSYTYSNVLITKNITYGGNGTTTTGTATGVTISNNYNSTNPSFTNISTKDFSLQLGSPAINVGYPTGIVDDINGDVRDASIDIGAYEYPATPIYYVAKSGSDSNPGTEPSPFLTITKALTMIPNGGTVYIKAGTYQEYVWLLNSGTKENPIVIKNYGSDVVTIDAQTRLWCMWGENVDNYRIEGINMINGTAYNLAIHNIKNLVVKNCTLTQNIVQGCTNENMVFSGNANGWSRNITLENNVCIGGSSGLMMGNKIDTVNVIGGKYSYADLDGITVQYSQAASDTSLSIRHILIDGTEFCYNRRQGMVTWGINYLTMRNFYTHHNGASGIQIEDYSFNVLLEDFVSEHNGQWPAYSFETGIWIDDTQNCIVRRGIMRYNPTGYRVSGSDNVVAYNLLIYDNRGDDVVEGRLNSSGINFYSNPVGTPPVSLYVCHSELYNSVIYGNSYATSQRGSVTLQGEGTYILKNNIIMNDNGVREVYRTGTNTLTSDYNIWYNSRTMNFTNMGGNISWSAWKVLGYDQNSLNSNPLFVAAPDFRIQINSPAINAGLDVGITHDYLGFLRTGTPDIGAYEYRETTYHSSSGLSTKGGKFISGKKRIISQ